MEEKSSPILYVPHCNHSGYSRACSQYSDFLGRTQLLTQKLLKHGYVVHRLKASLQKFEWIFYFLHRCFLSSITANTFIGLDYIYIVTRRVSYKKQELFTLREHMSSSPGFLVGSVLLIALVFCVVLLCVFTFWVPCCDVRYHFCIETMFDSSLNPVVCRGLLSYLRYVF